MKTKFEPSRFRVSVVPHEDTARAISLDIPWFARREGKRRVEKGREEQRSSRHRVIAAPFRMLR